MGWWFNGIRRWSGKIVAIRPNWSIWILSIWTDTFGTPMVKPLEAIENKAEEDSNLDDANLDIQPEASEEEPEAYSQCFFDPNFPDQDALKLIVRRHGQILFQPFDQEGLREESLHLEVDPLAQPYRFIRGDILGPLKALIDQFGSEGVLVSDISCESISHRA